MKQHITREQQDSISLKASHALDKWGLQHGYNFAFEEMSIGQMIEYLGRDYPQVMIRDYYDGEDCPNYYDPDELCDALWEAIKEVLEYV